MARNEIDHQHPYVGTAAPDVDGDTGDRSLTDQGDPSALRSTSGEQERREKIAQLAQSEDVHGPGGPGDPSSAQDDLVDGGPTQAGGTADEPPVAADPGGEGRR